MKMLNDFRLRAQDQSMNDVLAKFDRSAGPLCDHSWLRRAVGFRGVLFLEPIGENRLFDGYDQTT
jgi:hypothetical protein